MAFVNWLTAMQKHERKHALTGAGVEPDYHEHFDEMGVRHLVVDGKRNTYDEIQSHKDSVDINLIIKRYMEGDYSALDRHDTFFADITNLPKTYAEWLETQSKARTFFLNLPSDIRAMFNNSYDQFVVQAVNGTIDESLFVKNVPENPIKEVVEGES